MKKNSKSQETSEEKEQLLQSFILNTREGKYAEIESTSLPYARLYEERENEIQVEEDYNYSVS